MAAFEEFGILPEIAKALAEVNWHLPTPIQADGIPLALGGGDVLMAAEKNSGKTSAFCLPIVQIVWETLWDIYNGRTNASSWTPPWRMSVIDQSSGILVAPDGLSVESSVLPEKWRGTRCTRGVTSGKWGYEVTVASDGPCRVGWSYQNAELDLGTDKWGFAYSCTGFKIHNAQLDKYGEKFTKNDVLTCLLDMDNSEIRYLKNGVELDVAFNNIKTSEPIFPAVSLKISQMFFNFGEQSFKYSLPDSFLPLIEVPHDKKAINTKCIAGRTTCTVKVINKAPQALIIVPSRELAEKTSDLIRIFKKYLCHPTIKELLIVGGIRFKHQVDILHNRGADIVIATPARIHDFVEEGHLSLENCRFFVLGDADALLKQGHMDLIESLHEMIPKVTADGRRLQMIVSSSTLQSPEVKSIAENLMQCPMWVDLKGEDTVPPTVYHFVVKVDPTQDRSWSDARRHILTDGVHQHDVMWNKSDTPESLSEAVKILKGDYVLRAIHEYDIDKAMIFCRTELDCDNLEKFFNQCDRYRYSCVCVHGGRKLNERKAHLSAFWQNQVNFLICTDLAARRLDFTGLPFIINLFLPQEMLLYLERICRAGTEERMGLAISLVSTVPEKIWDHGEWCRSKTRGVNCWNAKLHKDHGCCIWNDEQQRLADIEEHLKVKIPQAGTDMKVPCTEVNGKIVYGPTEKKLHAAVSFAQKIECLEEVEREAQAIFLKPFCSQPSDSGSD